MRTGKRKTLIGRVHSDSMEKTITVNIETRYKHARYGKYLVKTKRVSVHDEKNEGRRGDRVMIAETRPFSKTKRWRLVEVLEKGVRAPEVSS